MKSKHISLSPCPDLLGQDVPYQYFIGRNNARENFSAYGHIKFQHGSVKEVGVNGCQLEDVLEIAAHRLAAFQVGPYACRENALALTHIQEAIHWLEHRTKQRQLFAPKVSQ